MFHANVEPKQFIPVGDQPAEVTFSHDGKSAFVANSASASVSVIDVPTKAVVKTVPVGEGPVGAWQGSNGMAYVDSEKAMTLSAIDTKTFEVKTTYDLGFTPGMAALATRQLTVGHQCSRRQTRREHGRSGHEDGRAADRSRRTRDRLFG